MSQVREIASRVVYHRHAARTLVIAAIAFFLLLPVLRDDPLLMRRLYVVGIAILIALGLNISMGRAGELFLGVSGLYTAGAYVSAILTTKYGWPFWSAALPTTLLAVSLLGVAMGTIGLRVSSWYFAIITFYISIVIPQIAIELKEYTGGGFGLSGIPTITLFGNELDQLKETYYLLLVVVVLALFGMWNLFRSPWGLAFATLAHSEVAMQALGAPRVMGKLLVYFLASLPAALAGAIYAHTENFINPQLFSGSESFFQAAAVVVGGMGTLLGPVVGMFVLKFPPQLFISFREWQLLIYGVFLIAIVLFIPHGLVPTFQQWWYAFRARLLGPAPSPPGAPSPVAVAGGAVLTREAIAPQLHGAGMALRAVGVSKAFGGVTALENVDFQARPGEITGLIGANGSGKTTFLNVVFGYYALDHGTVYVGDRNVTKHAPHRIVGAGVSRTFQTPQVVPTLTALENVRAGTFLQRRATLLEYLLALPRARKATRDAYARAHNLLALVGLERVAHIPAMVLPSGQRRLLEVARALASEPTVLLLDEPASGLSGTEVHALGEVLRQLRGFGMTIVLIEHNVPFVMALVDHVTVLDRGAVIASGTAAEVQRNPAVIASYLGEQLSVEGGAGA